MKRLAGYLEVNLSIDFDHENVDTEIKNIINDEFNTRTTGDLKYIKLAEVRIKKFLSDNKIFLFDKAIKESKYDFFEDIDDLEVELIGVPIFGNNPVSKYSGTIKCWVRSQEVTIAEIFSDEKIAFYSYGSPSLRFIQLIDNKIGFVVNDNSFEEHEKE